MVTGRASDDGAVVNRVVEIARLRPHPGNYKKHGDGQVRELRRSLRKFGQPRSIVVQAPGDDGGEFLIVAGHGVVLAARAEGWAELRCDVLPAGWPAAKVKAYLAADNELATLSETDDALLAGLVAEVQGFDAELASLAAGSEERLRELLAANGGAANGEDPGPQVDKAAELQAKWQVQPGDLWELGAHRLVCGDCTDKATVERVMGGEKANMVFTDPPYGVEFQGKGGDSIEGDISYALIPLLFADLPGIVAEKCWVYICGGSSNFSLYARMFDRYFRNWPRVIVWDKVNMTMRHNGYHSSYELIYYSFTKGAGDLWFGSRAGEAATDIWHVQKPGNERLHLTEKPVELPKMAIENTCPPTGIVFEPFNGSGSTLIACEKLGRRCRAIEIEPKYVAVCLERFSQMSGKLPVLVSDAAGA